MPIYEYEHINGECSSGKKVFEVEQSFKDEKLTRCPSCGAPVRRLISLIHVSTPTTNSEYKNMGFTKLVRRDSGVYENVTRQEGQPRYMEADKPDTVKGVLSNIAD
ncbi:MAG TPA: zinc ribbon domain-containing protein [Candidatus Sumerlaeota bacterium]|nr:zinc ribbon domain-containing protein [Candidatus Sumerlaeota bacterium]HRR31250.1 zinc ribbon domain-containing protein [Candidatus Sumerlaeia bacterium]HON49178.1 zinc ribbon domain-containing protein [Candidatus Sumerlaeota bacterium]HOR64215.1 zinc ribbon domain-containing protein [Candidatus Sumerlaeota bacterium]HPL73229.1 zinc ribbon domain-containing protein [Candidatus Sumerlaeota bacterium]